MKDLFCTDISRKICRIFTKSFFEEYFRGGFPQEIHFDFKDTS